MSTDKVGNRDFHMTVLDERDEGLSINPTEALLNFVYQCKRREAREGEQLDNWYPKVVEVLRQRGVSQAAIDDWKDGLARQSLGDFSFASDAQAPSGETPRVISLARLRMVSEGHCFQLSCSLQAAQEWCVRNGYVLEDRIGYKAPKFIGRGASLEHLTALLHELNSGNVKPGTILIIESLGDLTRAGMERALPLLMQLSMAGLVVVTLADERIWNESSVSSSLGSFVLSLAQAWGVGSLNEEEAG